MAKEIVTEVMIEGKKIAHFSSIIINQQFNRHNTFEVIMDHDVLEQLGSYNMHTSQQFVGNSITICFGERSTADNTFKGIITEVSMQQSEGLWGNIIMKGYSPTFLMESGNHYTSFYKKTLSSIVNEITGKLPHHEMALNTNPKFTKSITYTTQYKESNFAFINRLASEYGEWFFYDGERLFFGKPDALNDLELYYGENINDMSFSMRVVPTKVSHYSYNSTDDQVNQSESPASVDGASEYTQRALKASDSLFPQKVNQPVQIRASDKQQLDMYAKKQKGIQAAKMVLLTARGDNPKVKLGTVVNIKIVQKEIKGADTPEHGKYLVTSLLHRISGTGEYANTFEGIAAGSNYIEAQIDKPIAETQMAIVKDNADPEQLGRVRVQMLWQKEKNQLTDWVRVLTPDAGSSGKVSKNRGFVFIPEVNDQVILGFRYNDPDRPFVMGSVFHGKVAGGGGGGNNSKSLTTKSGSTISLDEAKGSVTVKDAKGNLMSMDGSGNITTTSSESIKLTCGDSSVELLKDGTINILGKIVTMAGSTSATFGAGDDNASSGMVAEPTKLDLGSKSVTVGGDTELVLGGGKVDLAATGETTIQGSKVNIN